jgi:flavin reductase (DIM6/NTAB) family NADH-FMN oxidoreductase RutF
MKKYLKLDKAHLLINHGPACLITSYDGKKANIMTVAWTTPINWEPPLIGVVIGEQAYSLKNILKTNEFAINIPTRKILKETIFCGSTSGKNIDKFKETGLTKCQADKIKVPLIKECIGHIECRVFKKYKFGDSVLFIGEVLSASVDDDLFDKCLRVDKLAGKTLHHLGGKYFTIPEKIISERS